MTIILKKRLFQIETVTFFVKMRKRKSFLEQGVGVVLLEVWTKL
jgi:hypothetical protein